MTPERKAVIEQLQAVGMSGYEAKAYLAMVSAGGPLSGHEVAKRSGVPRSTVYETIGKLISRGAAFEVRSPGDGTEYLALPAETFLRRLQRDFKESFDALSEALPRVSDSPAHFGHNLEGRAPVLARARDLIDAAREDLFLSVWPQELDDLRPLLEDAVRRGVDVSIVSFGDAPASLGHAYAHVFSDPQVVLDRVGCRLLVVAADRESVLIGGGVGAPMWGLFSNDPAVVLVAVEFVRHDIAMQVLAERMGVADVEELFATNASLIRLATGRPAPRLELHTGRPARTARTEKGRR